MSDGYRKVVDRTTTREYDKKHRLVMETIVEKERWERVPPQQSYWPTITYTAGTSSR